MIFELVTTRNCNLNCKYCFEGEKTNEVMLPSKIAIILEFINNYLEQNFIEDKEHVVIDFNGGEALLNKQFITSFINATTEKNYSYAITTNGILLDNDIIQLIKEKRIRLQISLDGKRESHNLNRITKDNHGSFDQVIEKLIMLKERELSASVDISLVVTPETVDKLSENILYILNLGFHKIYASYCADYQWSEESLRIFSIQLNNLRKIYNDFYNQGIPIYISLISENIESTLRHCKKPLCGACIDCIAILPNGNILPCGGFVGCDNEDDICIGNIYSGIDPKRINFYLEHKDLSLNNEECKICKLLSRCHHNCLAVNNRVEGSCLKIPECTCNINQMAIFESEQILIDLLQNKTFQQNYQDFMNLEESVIN